MTNQPSTSRRIAHRFVIPSASTWHQAALLGPAAPDAVDGALLDDGPPDRQARVAGLADLQPGAPPGAQSGAFSPQSAASVAWATTEARNASSV